ncbi:hypothetical protein [Priestia megaterium]|uniref:hypothetical protein n=1 Tax=Priestia megaterium TaxID=1404 RepID=UPI00188F9B54|nr:hypothetical protein [Priestia megaterium]
MLDNILYLINFFQITKTSDIISYVFGLIACLFTLVGLLSIFISINSQHNIQKCRELLWNLKGEEDPKKIIKDIQLYRDIVEDKSEFTTKVISICTFSIQTAIIIIMALNVVLLKEFTTQESLFIAIVSIPIILALYAFSRLLTKLTKITEISNLPTLENLLDAKEDSYGISTLRLASRVMTLHLLMYGEKSEDNVSEDHKPYFGFAINSPFEFKNINVTPPTGFEITSFNEFNNLNFDFALFLDMNIYTRHSRSLNRKNVHFLEIPLENFAQLTAKVPGYYHSDNWYILNLNPDTSNDKEPYFNLETYNIYQTRKILPKYDLPYTRTESEFQSEIFVYESYEFILQDNLHKNHISLGIGFEQTVDRDEKNSRFESKLYFNPVDTSEDNTEILGHIPLPLFSMGDSITFFRKG